MDDTTPRKMTLQPPAGWSRRAVLAASAGLTTSLLAGQAGAQTKRARTRKPIVLVHGAWHGGWCWRYTAERLRAAGHPVYTPTLTGLGDRAHLLGPHVDLETHIADISGLLAMEELDDAILVGHSYGGAVISAVADAHADQLSHLVYLDAVLLNSGESMLSAMPPARADSVKKLMAAGDIGMKPPSADTFGLAPGDPLTNWVGRHLTPHPLASLVQAVSFTNGGGKGLPRTYIECVKPSMFGPDNPYAKRARTEAGWTNATLDTGHDAMVSAPDQLARLLLQMAAG
jgi:pimeloyl-ACP methyl ester carboxylesterase